MFELLKLESYHINYDRVKVMNRAVLKVSKAKEGGNYVPLFFCNFCCGANC